MCLNNYVFGMTVVGYNLEQKKCLTTNNQVLFDSLYREISRLKFLVFPSSERVELTWLPSMINLSFVHQLLHQILGVHWSLRYIYLQILYIALFKNCRVVKVAQ